MARLFFHPLHWLILALIVGAVPGRTEEAPGAEGVDVWLMEATNHLGAWIWTTNSYGKQACRLWRTFDIPARAKITSAILHITVDNGYTLFLDGYEVGRGSDWRTVSKYDLKQILAPGKHILAVEAFNDRLEGGLIFGLKIDLRDQMFPEILSDTNWMIVPNDVQKWTVKTSVPPGSHPAVVVGVIGTPPWSKWPYGLATVPASRPVIVHFWQRGWFQLTLAIVCLLALTFCLWLMARLTAQARSQKLLQTERARIARDIHDDLGAQLTQLLLLGEVAQREQPDGSATRSQFINLCDHARALAHAMDEVVWAVNSRRDTVRDFTTYVCKYAQVFFSATPIRCRLDVEPAIPATAFDLAVRRNLFLAVKEALNNAAKHSQADELFVRIYRSDHTLCVIAEDNGQGFDPATLNDEGNGLINMQQRMTEIGGTCELASEPGGGCRVMFSVPLPKEPRRWFRRAAPDEVPLHLNGSDS